MTSVISCFRVILTGEFNFNIMLMIQDHFQGQKGNFKVKIAKIQVGNTSRNNCNRPTSFLCDFDWRIFF